MSTFKQCKAIPVKNGDVLVQSECPNCGNVNVHHISIEDTDTPQLVKCDTEDSAGCGKWYVARIVLTMLATVTGISIGD